MSLLSAWLVRFGTWMVPNGSLDREMRVRHGWVTRCRTRCDCQR
jgi:hypothetical protein